MSAHMEKPNNPITKANKGPFRGEEAVLRLISQGLIHKVIKAGEAQRTGTFEAIRAGEAQRAGTSELIVVEFPEKTWTLAVKTKDSLPKEIRLSAPLTNPGVLLQLTDSMKVIQFQFPIYVGKLTFWNSVCISFPPIYPIGPYFAAKVRDFPECGLGMSETVSQKWLCSLRLLMWVEENKDLMVQRSTNGNLNDQCKKCGQGSHAMGSRQFKCARLQDGSFEVQQSTFQGPGLVFVDKDLPEGLDFDFETTVEHTSSTSCKSEKSPLSISHTTSIFKQQVRFNRDGNETVMEAQHVRKNCRAKRTEFCIPSLTLGETHSFGSS